MDSYRSSDAGTGDDVAGEDILAVLRHLQSDDATEAERDLVRKALGITGNFDKNDFKDLANRWENEVDDGVNWWFSQMYFRWLKDKTPNDDWNTGETFFPNWVGDNYYKNNDDKGDKLTFDELISKGTFTYKALKRKVDWDNIGTLLSNAITNINQSNQIRQNSISQYQSEATRHFDLVNNTLKRMFDLMQTIGRNAA